MEKTFQITQAKAARLAGFLWVLTMATSMFATLYGFSRHVVRGDVAQTANNIIANETSFRIGIAWLGIFASALLALGSFTIIIFPAISKLLYPNRMVPMFFYEVGLGLWLWIKGARLPDTK